MLEALTPEVEEGLTVKMLLEVTGVPEEVLVIVLVREMVNPNPVEVVFEVWQGDEEWEQVTVSVSVSVAVLVGLTVKVTLVLVSVAVVEAGTVLVGEISKVMVVSSPPQPSVSVSVVVTSEVPVGLIEIVTRVTSVEGEETLEVLVGSIEMVTRVTSPEVVEASEVLVGSTEKVMRVTSVLLVEVAEVLPSLTVKVTLVISATSIKISENAFDNKDLLEGKKRLTTNSVNETISSHSGVAINCINKVSLTGTATGVVGVRSEG